MTRDFRFGVNLLGTGSGTDFLTQVDAVAASGADTVLVPDHLGMIGPMPGLVAAALRAPDLRVGTFVLNTAFYNPTLLARDLATVDQLSGGRLEIGLGAGYVAEEFEQAGLAFPPAGERVDHLAETVRVLRESLSGGDHAPPPVQTAPPIMVAGNGNRVLRLAAREADIVAISIAPDRAAFADRAELVRREAGDRWDDLTLNLIIFDLGIDRDANVEVLRFAQPDASADELRHSMNLLSGSVDEVVRHLRGLRDEFGLSYITLIEPSPEMLGDYGRVIARFRELEHDDA